MPARQRSIQQRVRVFFLLASAIVLFVTAAAFVAYEALEFRNRLVRNLTILAAVTAGNSAAPLAFDNKTAAEEILAAVRADPNIEAAILFDQQGNTFATYPPALSASAMPGKPWTDGHQFVDGDLALFKPVLQQGEPIGTLYLRTSLGDLYGQFWRYAIIVASVLLGAFGTAVVLSTVLGKRISEPILALTEAAQRITQNQDYSIRAPKASGDELGMLTDGFNHMVAETQGNQHRLAEQARLLDLSTDAIIVRDLDGVIQFWNRGAEELYGWGRAEALGRHKNRLLQTQFPEPLDEVMNRLQRDRRWEGELIQTKRDGARIYVSTRWVLDPPTKGNPGRVLITDNDITTQKQAEELMRSEAKRLDALVEHRTATLQETIAELEAFSYSISHDMRAPLRAMQGYAQALLADYNDRLDAEAKHYLERIFRAANRLDLLIQDVLAYSRVAKGEIELHPVNLERLVEDTVSTTPELQQSQIVVEKPLLKVLGHEAYLTQCVTNLLANAVKFVSPGVAPVVLVRSERLDGRVRVWFEDNGIGIDPSHHERIFQIFGQVHPEKKYGGTGIGLAIVRKAVQRMNGEVGVESELGKGSRFWLNLRGVNYGHD